MQNNKLIGLLFGISGGRSFGTTITPNRLNSTFKGEELTVPRQMAALRPISGTIPGTRLLNIARNAKRMAQAKIRVSGHGSSFYSKCKGFTDQQLCSATAAVDYALELLEEAELRALPKLKH